MNRKRWGMIILHLRMKPYNTAAQAWQSLAMRRCCTVLGDGSIASCILRWVSEAQQWARGPESYRDSQFGTSREGNHSIQSHTTSLSDLVVMLCETASITRRSGKNKTKITKAPPFLPATLDCHAGPSWDAPAALVSFSDSFLDYFLVVFLVFF